MTSSTGRLTIEDTVNKKKWKQKYVALGIGNDMTEHRENLIMEFTYIAYTYEVIENLRCQM